MMLQNLEHSIGSAETTCYLTIERFSYHGYSYDDTNICIYSLKSFTNYFAVFIDQDIAEKCKQEKQLLEMLLEEVCVCVCVVCVLYVCVRFSKSFYPDIK